MFYKHMVTEDTFKKLNFEQIEDDDKLYTLLGKLTHKEFNFALLNLGSLLKIIAIYFELKQPNIEDFLKLDKERTRTIKMEKIVKELNTKINLRYEFPDDFEVIEGLYTYNNEGFLLINKTAFLKQILIDKSENDMYL